MTDPLSNPLQASWENYERNVIAEEASETQRQVMRESFYAGAFAIYVAMTRTDVGLRRSTLGSIKGELDRFAKEVVAKTGGHDA